MMSSYLLCGCPALKKASTIDPLKGLVVLDCDSVPEGSDAATQDVLHGTAVELPETSVGLNQTS